MNLSRLASQWEEVVNGALLKLEKDAMRRLDSLVATIRNLIASAGRRRHESARSVRLRSCGAGCALLPANPPLAAADKIHKLESSGWGSRLDFARPLRASGRSGRAVGSALEDADPGALKPARFRPTRLRPLGRSESPRR